MGKYLMNTNDLFNNTMTWVTITQKSKKHHQPQLRSMMLFTIVSLFFSLVKAGVALEVRVNLALFGTFSYRKSFHASDTSGFNHKLQQSLSSPQNASPS